jgi:hypothetical protein
MKTWHVMVVGAAGAWIIVSLVQQQQAREELRALSAQVERLSAAQREQSPRQQVPPTQVVREVRVEVPVPIAAPVAAQAPGPAPATPSEPVPMEVLSERLTEHFGSEPPDTAWARDAEHTAREGVRAALPDHSRLRSVECRASMCRIETEHADDERSKTFVQAAFMTPGRQVWNGAALFLPSPDSSPGQVVMVTYLAREGMELPVKELLAPGGGAGGSGAPELGG